MLNDFYSTKVLQTSYIRMIEYFSLIDNLMAVFERILDNIRIHAPVWGILYVAFYASSWFHTSLVTEFVRVSRELWTLIGTDSKALHFSA